MTPAASRERVVVLIACVLGCALWCTPTARTRGIRTGVHDALRPAHRFLVHANRWITDSPGSVESLPVAGVEKLRGEVRKLRHRLRREQLRNADLHQQIEQQQQLGPSLWPSVPGAPLLAPRLINARVLSGDSLSRIRTSFTLDHGRDSGIEVTGLVLDDRSVLVDQGRDADIAVGQPVFAGRTVAGRISEVGCWTSRVLPVTDSAFSAHVRLIRRSSRGFVFGSEGILEGTGDTDCRLTGISLTEPVAVGDETWSSVQKDVIPAMLYYGKVVHAELQAGTRWDIRVEPAADLSKLRCVTVLQMSVNPERVARR